MNYKNVNDNEILYMISDNNEDVSSYIYEKYKPVVLGIAKRYYKYVKNTIIDFDDIVQSGYYALQCAIDSYDVNRNAMFYTFAVRCINNEILRAVFRSNKKFCNDNTYFYNIEDNYSNIVIDDNEDVLFSRFLNFELNKFSLDLEYEDSLVFLLRINGFSYKEIAHLLDIKFKKVDYIIQKSKNKLKKAFIL